MGSASPISSNLKFHRGRKYTDRYFERGGKETRGIRDKVEIRGNRGFFFFNS